MKIKAYRNYGVLGNEKRVICTVGAPSATALTYDEIEIEIPETFSVSENAMGSTLIDTPDGKTYLANELISWRNGRPVLAWCDGSQHFVNCTYQEVES